MSENPFEKKPEDVRPLDEAASDYVVDAAEDSATATASASVIPQDFVLEAKAPELTESARVPTYVTLIEDPFGIKSNEVAEAQDLDDELSLEEEETLETAPLDLASAEDSNQQLAKLAAAMVEEQKTQEADLAALAKDEKILASKTLEAQIAEDQALEAADLARQEAEDDQEAAQELQAALPSVDEATGLLDLVELQSCLESLLFMSDKPLSAEKLRDLIGPDFGLSIFQEAVTLLRDRYQQPQYGIEIVEVAGGLQFRTKPGRAALARKLAKVQTQRLSSGAMESLAIVAYRQPVMKEEIDKVRGVDSSYFIRGLMDKKLIRISGRSELPGRPMLYSTSDAFLELFGLKDLSALPSLRELEQMVPTSETRNPDDEDPRVREMRRLVSEMKMDPSGSLNYDPKDDDELLKEMREKILAIPTSTPYLEEQKALEKARLLAEQAQSGSPDALAISADSLPENLL